MTSTTISSNKIRSTTIRGGSKKRMLISQQHEEENQGKSLSSRDLQGRTTFKIRTCNSYNPPQMVRYATLALAFGIEKDSLDDIEVDTTIARILRDEILDNLADKVCDLNDGRRALRQLRMHVVQQQQHQFNSESNAAAIPMNDNNNPLVRKRDRRQRQLDALSISGRASRRGYGYCEPEAEDSKSCVVYKVVIDVMYDDEGSTLNRESAVIQAVVNAIQEYTESESFLRDLSDYGGSASVTNVQFGGLLEDMESNMNVSDEPFIEEMEEAMEEQLDELREEEESEDKTPEAVGFGSFSGISPNSGWASGKKENDSESNGSSNGVTPPDEQEVSSLVEDSSSGGVSTPPDEQDVSSLVEDSSSGGVSTPPEENNVDSNTRGIEDAEERTGGQDDPPKEADIGIIDNEIEFSETLDAVPTTNQQQGGGPTEEVTIGSAASLSQTNNIDPANDFSVAGINSGEVQLQQEGGGGGLSNLGKAFVPIASLFMCAILFIFFAHRQSSRKSKVGLIRDIDNDSQVEDGSKEHHLDGDSYDENATDESEKYDDFPIIDATGNDYDSKMEDFEVSRNSGGGGSGKSRGASVTLHSVSSRSGHRSIGDDGEQVAGNLVHGYHNTASFDHNNNDMNSTASDDRYFVEALVDNVYADQLHAEQQSARSQSLDSSGIYEPASSNRNVQRILSDLDADKNRLHKTKNHRNSNNAYPSSVSLDTDYPMSRVRTDDMQSSGGWCNDC